jgi:hypothetical protein
MKDIINIIFWKYYKDGSREPSKFHYFLHMIFGKFFYLFE